MNIDSLGDIWKALYIILDTGTIFQVTRPKISDASFKSEANAALASVFGSMATYQDIDWTWLKEASQQLANSGASALHKVLEPEYFSTLLGPNTVDMIRGIVGNEYLSTGAFLLICGSLLGPSSAALHNIQSRFWKAISVSVTIEERDEIYQAVEDFLTDLSKECKINNLIATKNMTSNPPKASNSLMTTSTSNVQYAPGYGQHEIYYKGKKIRVRKERQATQLQNQTHQIPAVATSQGSKIINLWTLSRNSFCLQELIDEAMQSFRNKNSGKIQVYHYSSLYNQWSAIYLKSVRSLESVVLPVGVKEEIIEDVAQFFTSSNLYKHQSIPYRRTYLFEGPPGTGKSSLIQALAGHFQLNICMVNLSDSSLTESTLIGMMNTVPPNSMILIEDVDALAARANFAHSGLSWNALLNCLDGIVSQEGTVLFMTTNSTANLDAAFLRPGRIDNRITFNLADDFQIRQLFMNFYGRIHAKINKDENIDASYGTLASFLGMKRKVTSNSDKATKMAKYTKQDIEFYSRCFANYIRPYTVSPAELQSFFLSCRDDSIENVAHKGNTFLEMVKTLRPTQQLYTPQKTPAERSFLKTSSPISPLQLRVSERTLSTVSYATPSRSVQQKKQVKKAVIVSPCEKNQTDEEPAVSYSKDSPDEDEVIEDESESEDESEVEGEGEGEKGEDEQKVLQDLLVETHDAAEYDTDECAEKDVELEHEGDHLEIQLEHSKQAHHTIIDGQKVDDSLASKEERSAISLGTKGDEKQLPQKHEFSDTDAETVAQSENDDTDELRNETVASVDLSKDEYIQDKHSDISNDADEDADGNAENIADIDEPEHVNGEADSKSDESEVDMTPSGKPIVNMPYPSPRKQEKVVADVLKHKMSQGQSFLEATTAIFKEGIQGIEAAVINRVLGEKSVTPIKRVTDRVPSFKAKRANSRFNRKLRRERQQQAILEENERHESKSDVKRESIYKLPGKVVVKDEVVRTRHKEHHPGSNNSPLRKFAKSQRQTSLRRAANMAHGSVKNSEKSNTNTKSSKHDSDPDSSEYDSGTERARKDLEEFLQRKSGNKSKSK